MPYFQQYGVTAVCYHSVAWLTTAVRWGFALSGHEKVITTKDKVSGSGGIQAKLTAFAGRKDRESPR